MDQPHFNLELLKIELSPLRYIWLKDSVRNPETYFPGLPTYTIARCPMCQVENTEKLDTYSLRQWPGVNAYQGKSVWGYNAIERHCEHFALVQAFVNFHGRPPTETLSTFGPEVPHVIGHLLEHAPLDCQAVIHALPICRLERQMPRFWPRWSFVPRYTLFLVSYFSPRPKDVHSRAMSFNAPHFEPGYGRAFYALPDGRAHWWDLTKWVEAGQLHWMAGPHLDLYTHDVEAFPYGGIEGRTYPYLRNYQSQPSLGAYENLFEGHKPSIARFEWTHQHDADYNKIGPKLRLYWDSMEFYPAFSFETSPIAGYWLPPEGFEGQAKQVHILTREIQGFVLRPTATSGEFEVVLNVKYSPGERTLGLTDDQDEAQQWVNDVNQLLQTMFQR